MPAVNSGTNAKYKKKAGIRFRFIKQKSPINYRFKKMNKALIVGFYS